MRYHSTKQPVLNRGVALDTFLDEPVAWGKPASNEIFEPNNAKDIYSSVAGVSAHGKERTIGAP